MEYKLMDAGEVDEILNDTRQISKDPYKLFVAFVLASIYDEFVYEDGEDIELKRLWNARVPKKVYDEIFNECVEDFMAAVNERLMISVMGEEYTIRNAREITEENLRNIFGFPSVNGFVIIDKALVTDFGSKLQPTFKDRLEYGKDNKLYFKKIVWLACHKRYDDLTDMEAAAYCFALHFSKNKATDIGKEYFLEWYDKWFDYFRLPKATVLSCLEDDVRYPQYYFSFSARKTREVNAILKQESAVDEVDEKEAEDYWYEVASIGKFK